MKMNVIKELILSAGILKLMKVNVVDIKNARYLEIDWNVE